MSRAKLFQFNIGARFALGCGIASYTFVQELCLGLCDRQLGRAVLVLKRFDCAACCSALSRANKQPLMKLVVEGEQDRLRWRVTTK